MANPSTTSSRRNEFTIGATHNTQPGPSKYSEQYARDNDFDSQADMRGEDW